jgi:hypothetical protein
MDAVTERRFRHRDILSHHDRLRYGRPVKHTDLPHSCDDDDWDGDCLPCVAAAGDVKSDCRCGECCRSLILEALPEDALVEPRIAAECETLRGMYDEMAGYLLNGKDGPCVFLDRVTNLCTIHDTRPLMCRLFNCDGEGREQLIELGILPPRV